mgnify:FL=1|tara:strand:- start:5512 stop:6270 length:759 start_codon:yes stop_codon:yes gene_type:complete
MSRFGWAYVNCEESGSHTQSKGVSGSVMFMTDPENQFISGSDYLMYKYDSTVPRTGDAPVSSLILTGTLYVSGAISASHFHYEDITRIDASGSTRFGNTADDTHQRTGSLYVGAPEDTLLEINVNASQSINFGSMRYAYKTVSGGVGVVAYASAAIGDYIIGVKGQCPVEIRIPPASASINSQDNLAYAMTGNILVIKDEYTGEREEAGTIPAAIFLSGTDGETIDGEPYYQMTGTMTAVSLYSNGSNWFVF